ncbi:MAG: rhodanese-like domain-containing protein [Kordia sp.]|uniref:rhodanese-like domain-containing protein n=1 Tax=Kordia sp. TaxID=1965332 RepID=UPI00385A8832
MKLTKLIFAILISLFLSCTNGLQENDVTVTELYELLENKEVIVLDVRTPKEIAQGKIKSSALEANFFDDDFLEKATTLLPKDKDVYVYCRSGGRSGKAAAKLKASGYTKIHNVTGGINAWKAKGYKVE